MRNLDLSNLKIQKSGLSIKNVTDAFLNFFLLPASTRPLIALRIGISLILIVQAITLGGAVDDLLSSDGFIPGDIAGFLRPPYTPSLPWLFEFLRPLHHLSEASFIHGFCFVYFICLILFAFGVSFRVTSVLVWFFHWTLTSTAEVTTYGVDLYLHVFLFYLMFMPAGGNNWSREGLKSSGARLSLRVLQLQLAITYLCSGLEKAQGEQWWNGELLWRALNLPVYRQFDATWLVNWPTLLKIGGWMTLLLETGYCVFIWPKLTRPYWLAGMIGLHLGIALFLGLHLFGVMMCIFNLALFGIAV